MSNFPSPTASTTGRLGGKDEPTEPQCVCATCMMRMPMPRSSSVFTSFQCPQCRMNGMDAKLLYTRRSKPVEHSTR
ncbi:hypothetical protein ABL78_2115 [Leptomonas seymouri]|uniref:Uncharacterized protein n=1 Tax=Leptomonas seymouri TaxID=5684 RepID=A0A0N1IM28_LEPSE|nr:hypothetical protein ABL78_2115 [Leptomonas seymouri]|eukprot:KPI88800.1 hypothetical protein ABL78_2115 [Leptomonas seymouri]